MSDRSGDALVELTDAEMCSGGPVKTLGDCRCAPELLGVGTASRFCSDGVDTVLRNGGLKALPGASKADDRCGWRR